MNTEYMSIREVAKKLRVDYQVIRVLVIGGKIKASKIGKQYRILESDLDEFLRINTVIKEPSK